ncbi:hypothetical protein [Nocardia arizonensis]|uniref:hypothetical protein n=1 Tax=Nocardia arizonensis TaxID=1141647 RepID=UPI0006D15E32|nr:hypothetical protein [Nocardia arizonensis]
MVNRPGKDFAEAHPTFSEKVREQFVAMNPNRVDTVVDASAAHSPIAVNQRAPGEGGGSEG